MCFLKNPVAAVKRNQFYLFIVHSLFSVKKKKKFIVAINIENHFDRI